MEKQNNNGKLGQEALAKAAKQQTRYIYACVGLLLYTMPGVACVALGVAMGAAKAWMIAGAVMMFISAGLGFLGLMLMSKYKGKVLMRILTLLMACLIVVPVPFVGAWYLVFLPVFILLIVCLANAGSLGKKQEDFED